MEKQAFVGIDADLWWLLAADLPSPLEDRRRLLGTAFGWTDPQWFSQGDLMTQLYDHLSSARPDLLTRLDETLDDDRQLVWIDDAIATRAEPAAHEAQPEPEEETAVEESAPEPLVRESAPTVEPKKSIFAKKAEAAVTAPGAEVGAEASAGEAPRADVAAPIEEEAKRVIEEFDTDALASELGVSKAEIDELLSENLDEIMQMLISQSE